MQTTGDDAARPARRGGFFARMIERLPTNATIGLACGEPRTVGATTMVPVGMVAYCYGFGGGEEEEPTDGTAPPSLGGGGGGGGWMQSVAIVTITNDRITLLPVLDWTRIILGLLALAGTLLKARRSDHRAADR